MTTLHISTFDTLYALEIDEASRGASSIAIDRVGAFDIGADVHDIGFADWGALFALSDGFGERRSRVLSEVDLTDAGLTALASLGADQAFNGLGAGVTGDLMLSEIVSGALLEIDLSAGALTPFAAGAAGGSAGDVTVHEGLVAQTGFDDRGRDLLSFFDADGDPVSSTRMEAEVWGLASLGENNLIGAVGDSIVRIDETSGEVEELYDLSGVIDGAVTGLAFGGPAIHDVLYGGNGSQRIKGGIGDDAIFGGNGEDRLLGARGDDVLGGDNGKDVLRGNAGDDWLAGGNGKDKLAGGGGFDILDGGRGKDRIDGGWGDDLLSGGKGRDTFVFHGRAGDDVVEDWGNGPDRMVMNLRRVDGFADLTLDDTRDGLLITSDRFDRFSVLLADATSDDFDHRDVMFV
ncbi:Hemolysin-type calcium-binding repeat-containing protein [Albimonas donghaensis]|uniref:Hemolysin-type calcium-binding repeat-containing protein n=1 Tax=Albimonas donghaensis TaxID=356660 RepID=A0A1H2R266_9RHOB|nr:calcium-binding protein [Albimonas donghaensis]SDW12769.1 Hemolysin-type calcium-binding repeat-containing protein [Albimonas donghaensis]